MHVSSLVIESKTLQGDKGEHSFNGPGTFVIENTTVEFQKSTDREVIKIQGPLGADFIIKVGCAYVQIYQDIASTCNRVGGCQSCCSNTTKSFSQQIRNSN